MITRRAITSTAEWLRWRLGYLGCSDVGAAYGVDHFRSPLSVYSEKAGLLMVEENAAMRRGRHFEHAGRSYFAEDHYDDMRVVACNTFLMDDECRLAGTPDTVAEFKDGTPGLINVQHKVINKSRFESWHGEPPLSYRLQVLAENYLLDASFGILHCLVVDEFGAETREFVIERHPEAEEKIKAIARAFWKDMEAGTFPDPNYRLDGDLIKQLFQRSTPGEEIDLSSDNRLAEILPKRAELKERVKADTEEIDAIDAEIRAKVGTAETATLPGWKITIKDQVRRAYSVSESTSRPIRVTERKD